MDKAIIRNPFNYVGAKHKLLPQIIGIINSEKIDIFVDMFGGSGEVSLNVPFKNVVYNDKNFRLVNILKNLDDNFIPEVDKLIEEYNLSKDCKEEYGKLREKYNSLEDISDREHAVILYTLLAHSFNNQIGFNKNGKFNIPQGKNRSSFNDSMRTNLETYIKTLKTKDIQFHSCSFDDIDWDKVGPGMLFYADPPYLITTGSYERDYLVRWSEENERKLYDMLDKIDEKGAYFALSNVLTHKGKTNEILKEWTSDKYNVYHLEMTYKACNYQTHSRENKKSDEVLVTNF